MRAQEFITEEAEIDDNFADGVLKFTRHMRERSQQRGIDISDIIKSLQRLKTSRNKDLRQLPPTTFVVKTPYDFEMAMIKHQDIDTKNIEYVVATVGKRLKPGAGQRIVYLEDTEIDPKEFANNRVMAKIERTGQIVQILRHEDQVKFSDEQGWFLVNTEPGRRTGTGVKWIPDSTRFAWVRNFESLKESKQATAQQVLSYINQTHHEPMTDKLARAVMSHPQWELVRVPLLNLNIPDQEYDDVDYEENPPESDPYDRVMTVEPEHAGEVSAHLVDRKPIVIDADRYIIDGNHRAWAAKYLLNRDYIQAWRPV